MFNYKRIHFIGIAGTGMSALAYIFAEKGYEVSGSDIQENISTIRLKAKGVKYIMDIIRKISKVWM